MKTESTVRPVAVERYQGLIRVNWDVREEIRNSAIEGGESVTMYVYRMMEFKDISSINFDKMTELLVEDKYPAEEQIRLFNEGTPVDIANMKAYRLGCKEAVCEVLGLPKDVILADETKRVNIETIDALTDMNILSGLAWKGKPVWLSLEKQFNYKAAYDFALQSGGKNLPVKFKLGEDASGHPVYHVFSDIDELTDFYTTIMRYVNDMLNNGWRQKDKVLQ